MKKNTVKTKGKNSPKKPPKNNLNDLTAKQWLKFLKTWFIHDGPPRNKKEILHPAKYPETMIVDFINFFTKKDGVVFDPFLGTGSTLVACNHTGRNGIGIELNKKYAEIAKYRASQRFDVKQKVITGNSAELDKIWNENKLPKVDFIICSPPYWNMLRKSRGGGDSTQKLRKTNGLDTYYSENPFDLGNIDDYYLFVKKLGLIFKECYKILKKGKYLVIIIQNLRDTDGTIRTLAWDLAKEVSKINGFKFQGEKIWCQSNKKLGIWGYPKIFVPSYHHHYCLIFLKEK